MTGNIEDIKKIAIIGAGFMGHGIAQVFAIKGYTVGLMDITEELLPKAIENIRANLTLKVEHGIGSMDDIEPAIARITTTTDMEEAAAGAQFVVEAVLEDLPLKQKVFKTLDTSCPKETILATNTSVMSITEIARDSQNRERIVGTHFWNPPHLLPLVEVIRGEDTSDETMDTTYEILKHVGKHPVKVQKDVPGFVANRLQHALWREAISIVENGVADAKTVDECIKYSFGIRLPVLSPMENADMVGLDLTLAIHEYILKHLENSPEPSPYLKSLVEKGDLGFKTGKGLQEWTPEEAQESYKQLQEYLMKVTK
ncbi:3-hydroxyacyl-CoA dehydrogenase family protein [Thermodesulfobacteriota bacterium]